MEIQNFIPPIQLEGLQGDAAIRHVAVYMETQISRMQKEIYSIRQFLEPAIINNKNMPSQTFNPLD